MRQGTPEFVGGRLREAREARGMNAITLADLLGVTRQAVSQYESDAPVTPHPDVMKRIAEVLNLPVRYFCRAMVDQPSRLLHFRALSSTTKAARTRSASRFDWLRDIVEWIVRYVDFPEVNVPEYDVPSDPALLSFEAIEEIATETRRYWGLQDGPISNVVRLLEKNGIVVCRGAVDSDIDAFATWEGDRPFIFLGSEKESAVRSRMDAAHELGHLILHRNVPENLANRKDVHKLMERQVNRFAGAFMIPAAAFVRELRIATMDGFRVLKPKWLMSIAAMIYRAHDLGLISEDHVTRLWKSRRRLQWDRREPLDDELPVEQPFLLRRSVEMMLSEGVVAKSDILAELPFAQSDLEELLGLPPRFLDDFRPAVELNGPKSNVVMLHPKRFRPD